MTAKVLFYVQHLLGIGHYVRAVRLGQGLAAAGFEVTLVSGGVPVPHIPTTGLTVAQLPPARTADAAFSGLVDAAGTPVDDAWKAHRRATLLDLAEDTAPDVLLLELFPFGRRAMRFELDPLIDAYRGNIPIATSVRDILVPPRPDRATEITNRVTRDIDLVLVHGLPDVVPFSATFPTDAIADRIVHTGYVGPPPPPPKPDTSEVLVSAGGGAVAAPLLAAAIAARPRTIVADAPWRIRVSPSTSDADLTDLRHRAAGSTGADCTVERATGDFLARLAACHVSVSQGGYNTLVETLVCNARAVCVPFAAGRESEQTARANAFADRGWLHHLPAEDLDPNRLAAAIDRAAAGSRPNPQLATDGAMQAAAALRAAV